MNIVLIVPTGLGCTIGGHAGDANPVAKLLGACCDKLITHPNVVNASDINEMPANTLYVEGSMLDRFLEGQIELKEVLYNKILVVTNKPAMADTINAVSAGRVTIGVEMKILELDTPLEMIARMKNGMATGDVNGWKELIAQVSQHQFDALAIHTPIVVHRDIALNYFKNGGINPWGGVEAKASKLIANEIQKPIAHAPIENMSVEDQENTFKTIVDPRIAPELISGCYLHCVLKGLAKAPRIGKGLSFKDVDFLVTPMGCYGRPHIACEKAGIPIMGIAENHISTDIKWKKKNGTVLVDNYIEAAGWIMAMKAGIHPYSVRRPLKDTVII